MAMTKAEVFAGLRYVLFEALDLPGKRGIEPHLTLQGDLGAESIDLLDIVFRLEREFGIKIPRGDLFPEMVFRGDTEMVHNGKVTEEGMEELRKRIPPADLVEFEKHRNISRISDLFTVKLVHEYLCKRLEAL